MSFCERFASMVPDLPDLAEPVRLELEDHAQGCRSCRAILIEHRALMAALRSSEASLHIEGERLTRYAIHRAAPTEPDYDQKRVSGRELNEIGGHVRECPRCRLAVESIIEQYREVDLLLTEAGVPPLPLAKPTMAVFVRQALEGAWSRAKSAAAIPSYPRAAAVALGSFVVVALWMGPWLKDPYFELANVEATEIGFLTRDSESALTRGISLMNEGRYQDALALLEPYSDGDSDPALVNYSHYLSGLAWVSEAKTEVFGRVLAYSESRLARAIEHLELVTESDQSGRVREDALWLLGKAHLMKRDPERAAEAFHEVEQLDGRRAYDARQLLRALRDLDDHGTSS